MCEEKQRERERKCERVILFSSPRVDQVHVLAGVCMNDSDTRQIDKGGSKMPQISSVGQEKVPAETLTKTLK